MMKHDSMKTKTMFSNLSNSSDGKELTFKVHGLNSSLVNALRRTILTNIPNIGFGYEPEKTIEIKTNTTGLNDEFIAHRISLIPVMIDDWITSRAPVNLDDYTFELNVSQVSQVNKSGYVTTDDFKVTKQNQGVETVLDTKDFFPRFMKYNTPILITRFPLRDSSTQKIHAVCKLMKGTHEKHACFSPTALSVAYKDDIEEDCHIFKIESMGIWLPSNLVKKGFELLIQKCENLINIIKDGYGQKYCGEYMAIDYVLKGESHTMGNMIQEWIYNEEFKKDDSGKNLSHISYHEPHPLEKSIIIRLVLKNYDETDFEIYKTKASELFVNYLNSLQSHISTCLDEWCLLSHPKCSTLMKMKKK